MIVALLQFELAIHDAASLKDKRRVVKSLKDRLHREHMVSVAEIAALENPAVAVLGLAAVGSEGRRLGEVLDRVQAKLLAMHDAELVACRRELIRGAGPEPASDGPAGGEADDLEVDLAAEMRRRADEGEMP